MYIWSWYVNWSTILVRAKRKFSFSASQASWETWVPSSWCHSHPEKSLHRRWKGMANRNPMVYPDPSDCCLGSTKGFQFKRLHSVPVRDRSSYHNAGTSKQSPNGPVRTGLINHWIELSQVQIHSCRIRTPFDLVPILSWFQKQIVIFATNFNSGVHLHLQNPPVVQTPLLERESSVQQTVHDDAKGPDVNLRVKFRCDLKMSEVSK